MKIIIDIPEKVVTAIQNGEDYRYDIHTAIAQGIPYEPKGDLISREALKKAITDATYNFEQIPIRVDKVQEIIDNAPTIERPHGKWIMVKNSDGNLKCYECSNCGKHQGHISNYCEDCGADMRGDT